MNIRGYSICKLESPEHKSKLYDKYDLAVSGKVEVKNAHGAKEIGN